MPAGACAEHTKPTLTYGYIQETTAAAAKRRACLVVILCSLCIIPPLLLVCGFVFLTFRLQGTKWRGIFELRVTCVACLWWRLPRPRRGGGVCTIYSVLERAEKAEGVRSRGGFATPVLAHTVLPHIQNDPRASINNVTAPVGYKTS